jgi:hypothetical protein
MARTRAAAAPGGSEEIQTREIIAAPTPGFDLGRRAADQGRLYHFVINRRTAGKLALGVPPGPPRQVHDVVE